MTKKELECENAYYKYILEGVKYYFYSGDSGRTLKDTIECLRALEIIKEKKVNVEFWFSFNVGNMTYEEYTKLNIKLVITSISKDLTRAEFDLLKEVLK